MWLSGTDRYPFLEGNLCSRHSFEIGEIIKFREGNPDICTREPVHWAYHVAQPQPPCDIAYPQFHLLYLEPVPRHVSIRRFQYRNVNDFDCLQDIWDQPTHVRNVSEPFL